MDAGKEIGGAAAIAATRPIAATEAIGLLTPRGELSAADGMRPSLPRPPASAAATQPVAPTVAELSSGAQLLLKLLGGGQPVPALQAAQPLLATAPFDAPFPEPLTASLLESNGAAGKAAACGAHSGTAVIAQALQGALETSGLFYESHLADWVGGQRSLDAIRTEPQALLHSRPSAPEAAGNAMADTGGANTGSANASTLNSIVHAQLDVIDSGQLRWQGELWPGMPAEIWLQRDRSDSDTTDGRQDDGQEADESSSCRWQARLVTTLPVLGKISTQFTLQGERLDLALSSSDATTASALKAAAPQLAGSLQATGLTLQAFASQLDDARSHSNSNSGRTARHANDTSGASDANDAG